MEDSLEPRTSPAAGTWSLRAIGAVAFGHGASDFYGGMVPLLIFYLVVREQHLSPLHQGLAGFTWYLASSVVQPAFGWYSDTRGRWWFLAAGVLCTVVSVGFIGFTRDYPTLVLLTVLGGLGSAVMHPEAGKYAAKVGSQRHGSAISIFQVGGQVGYSLGPIVIAALLERFGSRASALAAAPGLLAVAVLFWAMPRVHARAARGTGPSRPAATRSDRQGNRVDVLLLVGSTALRFLTTSAFVTYLPNVLASRGATLGSTGQVVTAFLLVGNLGLLGGGILGDRLGHRLVGFTSMALSVPALVGFFVLPGPHAMVSLLFASVLLSAQNAPGVALTQARMPNNLGMALGLINGVAFGVGSAAVALLGLQVGRAGAASTLAGVSLVPILGAVCFLMVGRLRPTAGPSPSEEAAT